MPIPRPYYWVCALILLSGALLCRAEAPIKLDYTLTKTVARDFSAFTQGLEIDGDTLLESSGLVGQSFILRRALPATEAEGQAQILWLRQLPAPYFAEGLTRLGDIVYLLSWQHGTGWMFDADSGEPTGQFRYRGEGWGLTHMGDQLVRSDGSDRLSFHAPENFEKLRELSVTWDGKPITRLNELEYAEGYLWANVWQDNRILAIDPSSGTVKGYLDLAALARKENTRPRDNVLNGIAYDPARDLYWVTGKRWNSLYQLKVRLPGEE
ncbi:glutaminyl-peptide cyclotransferase [Gilvimarinus algae]|uniref:Glutaminyl-peptide cyclotransferase n=1 Tax=Gilvimarinus algae TaxID=3058037 RepID=A0ABT8TFY2_9GAMM|nr:glutaminyl-peptide cyclotransferase [Gilvimarinus sp. SDUM040014]MDO3382984.1 glutaminyl-peptide cyclotransferase [Gilvimarinus sp. SDUM040014]